MSTIGFVTFESVSRFSGPPKNAGYATKLEMGIGVGVVGNTDGGGTIGGYLREKSQHDRIFAVTAHHVVSQGRVKISRSDNVQVESPAGIDLEQKDLEATKAKKRIVGTVFASSGLRTVAWDQYKCHDYPIPDGSELSMDWAQSSSTMPARPRIPATSTLTAISRQELRVMQSLQIIPMSIRLAESPASHMGVQRVLTKSTSAKAHRAH